MKKLGFGLMRLPLTDSGDSSSIDMERSRAMLDTFMQRGFTYFDTAYPYHNGRSEVAFREIVSERYRRSQFTLTDKMPCWLIHSEADLQRIFDEQLQRCGVSYFDYYWLHALNKSYYATMQRYGGFEFISRMKAEGKIRHIGFSFHDEPALLEQILCEHPEAEFVQLQINYLDWDDDTVQAGKCYEICRRHGKEIIVMEPVKGGTLASVPAAVKALFGNIRPEASPASWAIRYAASLPGVIMVLSGMSTEEQVLDNTSYMQEFEPLNDAEMAAVGSAAAIIKQSVAIPCTACHYCTDGCPAGIAIPEYFALYNAWYQQRFTHKWLDAQQHYRQLTGQFAPASECLQCGQCEEHCPQHIPIIDNLRKVVQTLEQD